MLNRRVLTLPGFFRPTKLWDLLVVRDGRLIAAIEFKSQVGPSFGNNANNRAEEAIGTAVDLWTAYREGAFGETPKPFLGYFFLLEDAPESRSPVEESSPHFAVFPEFAQASYADRYNILCQMSRPPVFGARHRHFKQEMFRRGRGSLVVNAYLQQVEFRCPELQMACPHCIGATKKQDRYRRSAVAGREVYRIPICHRRPCPAAPGSRALVGEDLQFGQHRARGPSTACHYYS